MMRELLRIELGRERDIYVARQRARQASALLGFDLHEQACIATAVTELACNAVHHAGGGHVDVSLRGAPGGPPSLWISVRDEGPGMQDPRRATQGPNAPGEPRLGLAAAQRIVDSFAVESVPGRGTTVEICKRLPQHADMPSDEDLSKIERALSAQPDDPAVELQQQHRELLRSLQELRQRQEELARLSAELEDTNRGVMALYAELDERATHLRLADETKTRFFSGISHELRTPVNSIMALAKILLHRLDGELTAEQEKQVRYICTAAEQLSTLIDDLLDLRKVEAGRVQMRPETFSVTELFGALRAMFKPLAVNESVALIIEDPPKLPLLHTDQGKVSQILRNLISNALKFTQRGWVRVSARLDDSGGTILFAVTDTGIGVAPEHHRHIFEEFTQLENALQPQIKGTGLGLPLAQRLAGLLGGAVSIASSPGKGSTFTLAVPVLLEGVATSADTSQSARSRVQRALIVDDDEVERYALRQFLAAGRYEVIEASGGYEGLRLARQSRPDLIFLDLIMPDVHGAEVLKMLRASDETRAIPIVLFTSQPIRAAELEEIRPNAVLMKQDLSRESVMSVSHAVLQPSGSSHARDA